MKPGDLVKTSKAMTLVLDDRFVIKDQLTKGTLMVVIATTCDWDERQPSNSKTMVLTPRSLGWVYTDMLERV